MRDGTQSCPGIQGPSEYYMSNHQTILLVSLMVDFLCWLLRREIPLWWKHDEREVVTAVG